MGTFNGELGDIPGSGAPMIKSVLLAAFSAFGGSFLLACTSTSITAAPGAPAGNEGGNYAGTPSDASTPDAAGASDAGADSSASYGSFGVTCNNPINTGGGDGGGTGSGGGSTTDGGIDPACVGVYDLCASIGGNVQCTKRCTYTGTTGPKSDPMDCPMPPTNGKCTPRGFCQ
jgi:hypothetical protein